MIAVACVLRSGGRYDATWVAKLQRGVARHLDRPHRFVCLSDVPVPCDRIRLISGWPGWWSKVELFRPGLFPGPVLYIDLDCLIVGPLSDLTRARFTMTRDFLKPDALNSGVMAWTRDYSHLWRRMCANSGRIIRRYDRWHDGRIGDQSFLQDNLGAEVSTFPSAVVASYRRDCKDGAPAGAAIVSFHGRQKMPDLLNVEWIKRAWN